MGDPDFNSPALRDKLRKQDYETWEAFVKAKRLWVLNWFRKKLSSRYGDDRSGEADDLCQETFGRAFWDIRKFEGRSRVETWLRRIVMNVLNDFLKKGYRKRRAENKLGADPTSWLRNVLVSRSPEEDFQGQELEKIVNQTIKELPQRERKALLYDIEGLTREQIRDAMGLTGSSVYVYIMRARRSIRQTLVSIHEPDLKNLTKDKSVEVAEELTR